MNKDLKFFMREQKEEIVEITGPSTSLDETGKPVTLKIRTLNRQTVQDINNKYRTKSIATDKRGNPIVANGEVVWKIEKDLTKASRHIFVEALAYPDLKDKELMAFYKCPDITLMPDLVFSNEKEYRYVNDAIMKALGYQDEDDDDEVLENAKN